MLDLIHSLLESSSGCLILPIMGKGCDLAVKTDNKIYLIEFKELNIKNE
jgi:hypothetical protein